MLSLNNCRDRQRRFLDRMVEQGLSAAVLANPKNVYYLTGALNDPSLPQIFVLTAGGRGLLVSNAEPRQYAAEGLELYTAYTLERPFLRHTMHAEAIGRVARFLQGESGTIGLEFDSASAALAAALPAGAGRADLTPVLLDMRRRKDPDEIECIRAAIRLAEAGYRALKARLEPGWTECDAYLAFFGAMVEEAGTAVDLRGDFAAGTRAIGGGGPPTRRRIERGDLYILDIFPVYRGYCCDLCRTFAAGEPSALQRDAWAHIMAAHAIVARILRPGVTGRAVYEEVRAHLESFAPARGSFTHHLGHGVGMEAWEFPWLTPGSGQEIREGDVIAVEPGLYSQGLRGGIRLERNYLVGRDGVTPLDDLPLDL